MEAAARDPVAVVPGHGGRPLPRMLPAFAAFAALAAHFLRAGHHGLVATALAAPLLLGTRWRWAVRAVQGLLVLAAVEWGRTLLALVELRRGFGEPWGRAAAILGLVAALTALAALPLGSAPVLRRADRDALRAPLASFWLTAGLLAIVQVVVPGRAGLRMLLLDRFLPGFGWLELLALATYAGWLAARMSDVRAAPRWRVRAWTLFTVVFFGQLALGLLGFDRFLQTGELHLPVPALILAGPVYRGERFFMPILFLSTVALVGPAWCSHLCYVGAWDQLAARARRRPGRLPAWRPRFRWGTTALVVGAAIALRAAGASPGVATAAGAAFGLLGVGAMAWLSRRTGVMTHCTAWCPMGLVATRLGWLNPFRVRIADTCTECFACTTACRFDALSREDVRRRRPGEACTLCGDCLARCPHDSLEYRFAGLRGPAARAAFLVLVTSLHAAFLGLARI